MISGLEKEGYIVITSVSSADAAARIDSTSNGYVKALVLDPAEVSPIIRIICILFFFIHSAIACYTGPIYPISESNIEPPLSFEHSG